MNAPGCRRDAAGSGGIPASRSASRCSMAPRTTGRSSPRRPGPLLDSAAPSTERSWSSYRAAWPGRAPRRPRRPDRRPHLPEEAHLVLVDPSLLAAQGALDVRRAREVGERAPAAGVGRPQTVFERIEHVIVDRPHCGLQGERAEVVGHGALDRRRAPGAERGRRNQQPGPHPEDRSGRPSRPAPAPGPRTSG